MIKENIKTTINDVANNQRNTDNGRGEYIRIVQTAMMDGQT